MVLGDSKEDVEDRDSKASADPSVSCECPFSWRLRCNRCTSSLMVAAIISINTDRSKLFIKEEKFKRKKERNGSL